MMVVQIAVGPLEMVPKGLEELEISGRIETIQGTGLLKLARIFRRVLETLEDLL